MENVEISIIIPVYNAEKYLRKCLESVLSQTFVFFECLLVDDGSTDGSGKICDEYASSDLRFKVFHKTNGGVSSARNVGIRNATGAWITFVDADDFVKVDYLANLHSHTSSTIDMVISYAEIHRNNGSIDRENYPSKLITRENFDEMFIDNDIQWHTSPWSKLYRREIIEKNNLSFCVGMHISEDALFNFKFMALSRSIYISKDTDYCYFKERSESLTKRLGSFDSELLAYTNIKNSIFDMIEVMNINTAVAKYNLLHILALDLRRALNALYKNKVPRTRRMRVLRELGVDIYVRYIGNNLPIKERIYKCLLKYNLLHLYDWLRYGISYAKNRKIKCK